MGLFTPSEQIELEMARELDDLEKKLTDLHRWLNGQQQPWWVALQAGLIEAEHTCWTEDIQVAFNQYRKARTDTDSRSTSRNQQMIERQRLIAGKGITNYMAALQQALQSATAARPSAGRQ